MSKGHTDGERLSWLESRLGWDVGFNVWWHMPNDPEISDDAARKMPLRQLIDAAIEAEEK
jgi:hypothetical protein